MSIFNPKNIAVLNIDKVTDVIFWNHQLTANVIGETQDLRVGNPIFVIRDNRLIGLGRITNFQYSSRYSGRRGRSLGRSAYIRMDIRPVETPLPITRRQREIIQCAAKQHGLTLRRLDQVLALSPDTTQPFSSLLREIGCQWLDRVFDRSAMCTRDESVRIMERNDIDASCKINLCLALEGKGELADVVVERDFDRIECDDEYIFDSLLPTRIVPWNACSDTERLDPDNYLLLDPHRAQLFCSGLLSFSATGEQIDDPSMSESFCTWIDPSFTLPKPNKAQRRYLAYHRKYVFKQWRLGSMKPLYVRHSPDRSR